MDLNGLLKAIYPERPNLLVFTSIFAHFYYADSLAEMGSRNFSNLEAYKSKIPENEFGLKWFTEGNLSRYSLSSQLLIPVLEPHNGMTDHGHGFVNYTEAL